MTDTTTLTSVIDTDSTESLNGLQRQRATASQTSHETCSPNGFRITKMIVTLPTSRHGANQPALARM